MTHCERVLDYMRRKGSISQKEAADAFGCERLSGRIYDLKRMGYRIVTTFDTRPNRFGDMTRFARYYLITEEELQRLMQLPLSQIEELPQAKRKLVWHELARQIVETPRFVDEMTAITAASKEENDHGTTTKAGSGQRL